MERRVRTSEAAKEGEVYEAPGNNNNNLLCNSFASCAPKYIEPAKRLLWSPSESFVVLLCCVLFWRILCAVVKLPTPFEIATQSSYRSRRADFIQLTAANGRRTVQHSGGCYLSLALPI